MHYVVVGIPAYNEEKTIAKVVLLSQKVADEVVVCDDGSKDLTSEIARKLGATVIRHKTNMGKGSALRDIFRYALSKKASVLVTIDADGQHDPEEIPDIIRPIMEGKADVCVGRRSSKSIPYYRRVVNRLLDLFIGLFSGRSIVDTQSGFRAYSSNALKVISVEEEGMGVDAQILLDAQRKGLRIVEVPVSVYYKGLNCSKTNPVSHVLQIVTGTLRYLSVRHPLSFYGFPGFILLILGLMTGFKALSAYYRVGNVLVGTILFSLTCLIVGILFMILAIILFILIPEIRLSSSRTMVDI